MQQLPHPASERCFTASPLAPAPPTLRLVVNHPGARQLVRPRRQAQPRGHAVVELGPGGGLAKRAAACAGGMRGGQVGWLSAARPVWLARWVCGAT